MGSLHVINIYSVALSMNQEKIWTTENRKCEYVSFLGQGGHAYLKEWLWWAGMLTSKGKILIVVFVEFNYN